MKNASISKAANTPPQIGIVIPNWNGADELRKCLDSLATQAFHPHIIVVDNGSVDESVDILIREYPQVELIRNDRNEGYTGGVNPGFQAAIDRGWDYVAPFNNDAIADRHWLKNLVEALDSRPDYGIATCKLLSIDGKHLDSTGDYYTSWGLPYPRGRNESDVDKYDEEIEIFGASGGASLYRVAMLARIGLLDHDFFAYYEDVDISFRAQWAGWRIIFVPQARVYHATSTTGRRMVKGFFTYQTMKNLPMLLWKSVPGDLMPTILPRFALVYLSFFAAAAQRGQLGDAIRGAWRAFVLWPKKHRQRKQIRRSASVDELYIHSIITYDLPPNARRLRKLRNSWRKLRGRRQDQDQEGQEN